MDGTIPTDGVLRQAGILDTVFSGRVEELADGSVVPVVTGRAWVNGESSYTFNPSDPFRNGIPCPA